jgi:multidrug efflux pump
VASGLLVTTFLTLIVLPVAYTLTADLRGWLARRKSSAEED